MGVSEVEVEGWRRGRHANRCTIPRIYSGANGFDRLEASRHNEEK